MGSNITGSKQCHLFIQQSSLAYIRPASVRSVIVLLFIPSNVLPVSPTDLIAVTYTLYTVYGLRLARVYVPLKSVTLIVSSDESERL